MHRRKFIGGILWTTVFARLGFADGMDKTLLALAQVIIPDREPAVWVSSGVAIAVVEEIERMDGARKTLIATTLDSLSRAATHQEGHDFHKLSLQLRTKLVKRQIDLSEEVRQGFTAVRVAALRCFYRSSVGRDRTGYRETNQFRGYPEHVRTAKTWE